MAHQQSDINVRSVITETTSAEKPLAALTYRTVKKLRRPRCENALTDALYVPTSENVFQTVSAVETLDERRNREKWSRIVMQ